MTFSAQLVNLNWFGLKALTENEENESNFSGKVMLPF